VLILNRNNLLRCLGLIIFLLMLVLFGQLSIVYLYLHGRFGMNQQEHAIMTVVSGVCGVVVQSIGLRCCMRFLSNKSVMLMGLVCLAVSMVMYGVMWTQNLVFVIAPVASIGMLSFPAITALKSNALGADEQGAIQGALSAVRSVGGGVGPLMFNQLMSATQGTAWDAIPFYLGAVMCAMAVAIGVTVKEANHVPAEELKAEAHAGEKDAPEERLMLTKEVSVSSEAGIYSEQQ
jgi:DHA1 family tetracycline resistance protein-like MFS transporter